jgi:hypothetical protein
MSGSGTTTIDFGAFPGAADTSVAITGQTGIVSGSLVGAWIRPVVTADHSADEHRVEGLFVLADTIVAGTGFTIYGREDVPDTVGNEGHRLYGLFTVAWAWT